LGFQVVWVLAESLEVAGGIRAQESQSGRAITDLNRVACIAFDRSGRFCMSRTGGSLDGLEVEKKSLAVQAQIGVLEVYL
jgi:hypothetical protein